jgi:S-adenosylhomocysteine hydrolase
MRQIYADLVKNGIQIVPKIRIEAAKGDEENVERIMKVLSGKGAIIVKDGGEADFTIVAHEGDAQSEWKG